jgi:riboflavin biosynthesis pyrimidine reductase
MPTIKEHQADFEKYSKRKADRMKAIEVPPLTLVVDNTHQFPLDALEHPTFDKHWGGPFYFSRPKNNDLPAVNLVFVEDKNHNTGTETPWTMGGGEADYMLYEMGTRAHVEAILAGSKSYEDPDDPGGIILSLWDEDLVNFRTQTMGRRRHSFNVLTTERGDQDVENLRIFNNPEIETIVITGDKGKSNLDQRLGHRKDWVHVESTGEKPDLTAGMYILRRKYGIRDISVIGGRTVATELLNRDLIDDLFLTTTPIEGPNVEPNSPFYLGDLGRYREATNNPAVLKAHLEEARQRLDRHLTTVIIKSWESPDGKVIYGHYKVRPGLLNSL